MFYNNYTWINECNNPMLRENEYLCVKNCREGYFPDYMT